MLSPQTLADYQAALALANTKDWASLLGYYQSNNQYPSGAATLPAETLSGWFGPGGPFAGMPTGATSENLGYYTDPSTGTKIPTLAAQESTGYVNIPGIGRLPTTQEQGQQQSMSSSILNAQTGPANMFSYIEKLGGLGRAGTLGGFLGNAVANAAGSTPGALAGMPNYSNTAAMTDAMGSINGKPVSGAGQSWLQMLAHAVAGLTGGATTTAPGAPGATTTSAAGAAPVSPLDAQTNPGWQTSAQDFGRLSQSGQQAYTDLQANSANGQIPTDFLSQLAQGAPTFQQAQNTRIGNVMF